MLSAEKNRILTQVGPGTPMGDSCGATGSRSAARASSTANPIKPIRLLGEDLVLYKDLGGRFGLLDRHCPHRRADLSYGLVEETRHPLQLSRLADGRDRRLHRAALRGHRQSALARQGALRIKAYPVQECAGLLWAYHGPAAGARAAGLGAVHLGERLPRDRARRRALQLVPVPGELHRPGALRMDARELERAARAARPAPTAPKHLKLKFEEFDHGFIYKRVREDSDERNPQLDGRARRAVAERLLSRQPLRVARAGRRREHALRRVVLHARAEGARALRARQRCRPGYSPIKDENGRWITSHVINQDIVAWVGQGAIADRTKENIGASDLGIAMIRKRFFDELDAIARGEDPKGVIRNSNVAKCVELPYFQKKESTEGITLEEFEKYPLLKMRLKGFRHCYGQPPEVRRAFEEAMGIAT